MLVSHTQIGVWNECPFQWKLGYKDKWVPKKKSEGLDRGNKVHELLGAYYTHIKEGGKPEDFKPKMAKIAQAWITSPDVNMDMVSNILHVIGRYISDWAPQEDSGWQFLQTEYRFEVPLFSPAGYPYRLQGYIDVVAIRRGYLYIWDHKSHDSHPWTDSECMMDSQQTIYAAALANLGYEVNGTAINMLNLHEYKRKEPSPDEMFKRVMTTRKRVELQKALHEFGTALDEIIEADKTGVYKKVLKKDCARCRFSEPCLMDQKGMPIELFLRVSFEQKESPGLLPEANEQLGLIL